MLVRELGISALEMGHESSREQRVEHEKRYRTMFVAHILGNLQCAVFNLPS